MQAKTCVCFVMSKHFVIAVGAFSWSKLYSSKKSGIRGIVLCKFKSVKWYKELLNTGVRKHQTLLHRNTKKYSNSCFSLGCANSSNSVQVGTGITAYRKMKHGTAILIFYGLEIYNNIKAKIQFTTRSLKFQSSRIRNNLKKCKCIW